MTHGRHPITGSGRDARHLPASKAAAGVLLTVTTSLSSTTKAGSLQPPTGLQRVSNATIASSCERLRTGLSSLPSGPKHGVGDPGPPTKK